MPESIKEAVSNGTRVEALKALRDRLADAIDNTESAREVGTLSNRLIKVLEEIEHLSPTKTMTAAEKRKAQANKTK